MIITRTPYRISFFGGGTDYPAWFENFGPGAVISTTIDKYCYLACRYFPPFFDIKNRIVWSKIELVNNFDEIEHPTVKEALKFLGLKDGVEIHHYGDLPARSGIGSSSSFMVGLLHVLHAIQNTPLSRKELALEAFHVEQERAKTNVGCQDHAAAAFGGFNRITFGGSEKINVQPVAVSPEIKELLENRLLMVFVGLARNASEIAAEQIKMTKQKESELRNMLCLVDKAEQILKGSPDKLDDFGRLLHETWVLKKSISKIISNNQIDEIYSQARQAGALGGKLLGAGSGGFMIFYVPPEKQKTVKEALKKLLHVPFKFENSGTTIIYSGTSENDFQLVS